MCRFPLFFIVWIKTGSSEQKQSIENAGTESLSAPGYRSGSTGGWYSVGSHGSIWSSTISEENSRFLYFHTQTLHPSIADGHTYGRLLRCLSE